MMLGPIGWLRSLWIPREEVRAEIWALGERHRGQVMAGARLEAKAPGISVRRAVLLKAVIRQHRGTAAARAEADWANARA